MSRNAFCLGSNKSCFKIKNSLEKCPHRTVNTTYPALDHRNTFYAVVLKLFQIFISFHTDHYKILLLYYFICESTPQLQGNVNTWAPLSCIWVRKNTFCDIPESSKL